MDLVPRASGMKPRGEENRGDADTLLPHVRCGSLITYILPEKDEERKLERGRCSLHLSFKKTA